MAEWGVHAEISQQLDARLHHLLAQPEVLGRIPKTKLMRLFAEQGQRPWLDNLTRANLRDGTPRGTSPNACG
jgi:hypothetical protein